MFNNMSDRDGRNIRKAREPESVGGDQLQI